MYRYRQIVKYATNQIITMCISELYSSQKHLDGESL